MNVSKYTCRHISIGPLLPYLWTCVHLHTNTHSFRKPSGNLVNKMCVDILDACPKSVNSTESEVSQLTACMLVNMRLIIHVYCIEYVCVLLHISWQNCSYDVRAHNCGYVCDYTIMHMYTCVCTGTFVCMCFFCVYMCVCIYICMHTSNTQHGGIWDTCSFTYSCRLCCPRRNSTPSSSPTKSTRSPLGKSSPLHGRFVYVHVVFTFMYLQYACSM
jgi:hypothetical protein